MFAASILIGESRVLCTPLAKIPVKILFLIFRTQNYFDTMSSCCKQSRLFEINRQTNAILNNEQQNATYARLVCSETFDADWIHRNLCKKWAHEKCACVSDARYYYCEFCL